MSNLPRDLISQAMAQIGAKGGKTAAKNMSPQARSERARIASQAAAKKRTAERLERERKAKGK